MVERVMTDAELDAYVGQNITRICSFGYTNEAGGTNHCAHFVGHLLGVQIGAKCARAGFSLRVNEVYNQCSDRGRWADMPTPLIYSLIFATQPSNMGHDGNMMAGRHKHMGIWRDPWVYNYSTDNRRVLKELVPDFQARLEGVYDPGGTDAVRLFYGRNLPI